MGGNQSNSINANQTVINSLYTNSSQSCLATCTEQQIGDTIVIDNVTIGGNFTGFNQLCTAQAACIMDQNLDSSSKNILSSMLEQSNSTTNGPFSILADLTGGGNLQNNVTVSQTIENMMQQNLSSFCQGYADEISEGNVLFIGGSNNSIAGNFVGVNQTGSANASCTMKNYSKMQTFNQESAKVKQTNKQMDVVGLIGIVVGVVVVVIIIIIGILLAKGVIGIGSSKSGGQGGGYEVTSPPSSSAGLESAAMEGAEVAAL